MGAQWLDETEQAAWRSYLAMRRSLERGIEHQLATDAGISVAEYQVLVPLSEAPGRRLRPGELARQAGFEASRLSHQLRRMEAKGLVRKEGCPTDSRGSVIVLTKTGRQSIDEAAPGHVSFVRTHFLDQLSSVELVKLAEISKRVVESLGVGDDES